MQNATGQKSLTFYLSSWPASSLEGSGTSGILPSESSRSKALAFSGMPLCQRLNSRYNVGRRQPVGKSGQRRYRV